LDSLAADFYMQAYFYEVSGARFTSGAHTGKHATLKKVQEKRAIIEF
jgi:hypothetical protein